MSFPTVADVLFVQSKVWSVCDKFDKLRSRGDVAFSMTLHPPKERSYGPLAGITREDLYNEVINVLKKLHEIGVAIVDVYPHHVKVGRMTTHAENIFYPVLSGMIKDLLGVEVQYRTGWAFFSIRKFSSPEAFLRAIKRTDKEVLRATINARTYELRAMLPQYQRKKMTIVEFESVLSVWNDVYAFLDTNFHSYSMSGSP